MVAQRSLLDRARETAGVAAAVLLGHDGACVDDGGGSGAALAGEGAYLAAMAARIGVILGAGAPCAAVARSTGRQLLLVPLGGTTVGALLAPRADPEAVGRALRDLLPAGG